MQTNFYQKADSDDFLYRHIESIESTHNLSPHTHNSCELLFVAKGNVSYVVEGKKYTVTKNTLIISRALQVHAISCNEPVAYERYNILFDETKYGAKIYKKIPPDIDVIHLNGDELICDLFYKMDHYCSIWEGEELLSLLQHLTEEILYNVVTISKQRDISSVSTSNTIVMQAIRYISDNIREPLPVEKICDALYITKAYLHSLFMTHLNTTPRKYVVGKKLRMAQADLQAGASPTEVSSRYGFADYATFYRNYKHYFGVTPSNWASVPIERSIF